MPHKIYTTKGFIIGSHDVGEGHKMVSVFTDELGLIKAHAKSVRRLESKLRPHLQDFSLVEISFVRGRELWRVTNSETLESYSSVLRCPEARVLTARFFSLISRLVQGEEQNKELFDVIFGAESYLKSSVPLDRPRAALVEVVTVLRILHALGYIRADNQLASFVNSNETNDEILDKAAPIRLAAIMAINQSLSESHL